MNYQIYADYESRSVRLCIDSSGDSYQYAAYLMILNHDALEKRWYQDKAEFKFNHIPDGAYQFRIFIKNSDGDISAFNTQTWLFPEGIQDSKNALELMGDIYNGFQIDRSVDRLIKHYEFFLRNILIEVISKIHTTDKWINKDIFYKRILDHLLINENPRVTIFAANIIFYDEDSQILIEKYFDFKKLIQIRLQKEPEQKNFLIGLLEYRVENYLNAELEFHKNLDKNIDGLMYHQVASLCYRHRKLPLINSSLDNGVIYLQNILSYTKGLVLFSCDIEYFNKYFEETFCHLLNSDTAVHVHLILPTDFRVEQLANMTPQKDSFGLSYEFVRPEIQNLKTYYATSRYLILAEIIERYDRHVLVADIDIDFCNADIDDLFSKAGDGYIWLSFKDVKRTPWFNIMAGFNVFGRGTQNSEFIAGISKFIQFSTCQSMDPWMLDQVAINYSYENLPSSEKSKIRPIQEIQSFGIRQYKK